MAIVCSIDIRPGFKLAILAGGIERLAATPKYKREATMIATADTPGTVGTLLADLLKEIDSREEGRAAYALVERLYPFCRSITGNGVRRSLRLLRETIPLTLREVASDTQVFDWTV